MKRLIYLTTVALVALLLIVPTAMAQEMEAEVKKEETMEKKMEKQDLPKSGGVSLASVALPAAALLVGGSVLGYAILRRR